MSQSLQEPGLKNNIAGKVVVIVDGASRLGAAGAHHLSNEGAIVVLGGAEIDRVRELAHELRWNGGKSIAVGVDAVDGAQLEGLVAAAVQAFGRVDVIVNNAAAAPELGGFDGQVDRALQGMLYGTAAALPYMQRRRLGQIINVPALPGERQNGTMRAVLALSDGLRKEFSRFNIRTTVISSDMSEIPEACAGTPDGDARPSAGDAGALRAESFARALAFAINQPDDLAVNEIQFRTMPRTAVIH
jgi:NADP-dependent 3-hydroxy acid dehydrogenase YdfG